MRSDQSLRYGEPLEPTNQPPVTVGVTPLQTLVVEKSFAIYVNHNSAVHLETVRGGVHLRGFVNTPEARMRAEEIARSFYPVKPVTNELIIAD